MDSTFVQKVPRELICYICKDYFTDPFTLSCGHNFCAPCLCLLWEDAQHPTCCPVCRAVSPRIDFKSILFPMKQVRASKESAACQLPNSAKQVCRIHLVVKDLFCPTEKSPLCFHCSGSRRHATHRHSPISQAAEQCREKLLTQMKSIWKSRQKNQKNLNKEYNLLRVWQENMTFSAGFHTDPIFLISLDKAISTTNTSSGIRKCTIPRQNAMITGMEGFVNLRMMMIKAEYPKVYQYLHEEKQKHLENLALEGKIVFNQLQRNVARMRHMRKLLRKMYEDLKDMYCKTDVDLFQDLGDIMKRSQLMQLHIPQPVNPQLSSWAITGMSERLNNFRVYLTVDHNISNYRVALFEDLRHLQCCPDCQDVPSSLASPWHTLLWGAQTFTSGKHYWEVDVGNSRNWIIGLCKESWVNRNDMLLSSEGIFLLLCIQVDDLCRLFSASPPLRHYIQRPQGWIGVFLDYECGTVSFVNVSESSLICNFLSCSFSCPLRPFICYGPK